MREQDTASLEQTQGSDAGASRPKRARDSRGAFLDTIIESLPAMVFVKDASELRFERVNRAGERLIGISRDQVIGKNDYDFFPPEQAEFFVAKDREVLAHGLLLDIAQEPIQTSEGTRWLRTLKIPILDESGTPRHLLGVSLDITAQKEAEDRQKRTHDELEQRVIERTQELERRMVQLRCADDALARTEAELRHSQKMEAIGRLAGGIAHDFNNLLSVVLGYADLSLSRVADDDALRRFLEQIHRAAIRASELTQQLLAFGRRQVLKPELLDLKYRVSEADGPRSALRLAETCGTIDLLLSDVVMPDGGGRVLAEQLLAQRPGLRVLFMSGYTDDAVVKRGVLKAGVAFMQKPLTAKMLAARVREALSDLSPTIPSFE